MPLTSPHLVFPQIVPLHTPTLTRTRTQRRRQKPTPHQRHVLKEVSYKGDKRPSSGSILWDEMKQAHLPLLPLRPNIPTIYARKRERTENDIGEDGEYAPSEYT